MFAQLNCYNLSCISFRDLFIIKDLLNNDKLIYVNVYFHFIFKLGDIYIDVISSLMNDVIDGGLKKSLSSRH